MSAFWHWFVIVVTVASLAGCLWLLFANAKGAPGEDTGHVWDDDLRERNNPLPRWWLHLFVITVVFAGGYLAMYPGLGNYAGRLGWTQQGQVQAALGTVTARRDALYAQFHDRPVDALAADPAAQSLGREVFLRNCAGCHGADGTGGVGPDLTTLPAAADEAAVVKQVTNGGQIMPSFSGTLSSQQIEDVAAYVSKELAGH